jgi:CheY-like chemotaxis protein
VVEEGLEVEFLSDAAEPAHLRVAVVDDSVYSRTAAENALGPCGHEVSTFADGLSLLASPRAFDVVVLDLELPGLTGHDICSRLVARGPYAPAIVVVSGHDDQESVAKAFASGAAFFVGKPFAAGALVATVDQAARKRRAEPVRSSEVPFHLGPYRVTSELGRGGMGVVFRARDRAGREVAVKVLVRDGSPERRGRADDQVRFRRELDLLASVEHPSLQRVLGSGVEDGWLWYAMELAPGATLFDELVRGPMPWRRVTSIGRDIASGLAHLHGLGIVHRDVKPGNIIVAGDRARLIDFGLARRTNDLGLTSPAEVLGTPLYVAPELVLEDIEPSPASDVFSLSVSLHEALAGAHPSARPHDNATTVIARVAAGRVAVLRGKIPELPDALAAAIDRGSSPLPGERPSASELARVLDAVTAGIAITGAR